MPTWPAKDPDAVKDYSWSVPLDPGDTVATMTFEKLSGSVTIDSENSASAPATLVAWLSGGTDGETSVFRVFWTTVGGRSDDEVITIAVVANEPAAATPYGRPRAADLIALYPAFAAVPVATIEAWIGRVIGSDVDESWSEASYGPAVIAAAAHRMAKATVAGIAADATSAYAAKGVTGFKSGTFNVNFSEAAANRASGNGWDSTSYGSDYLDLLAKRGHSAGVTNVGCGCFPYA